MVFFFVVMGKNIFLVHLKRNLLFLYKKMVFFFVAQMSIKKNGFFLLLRFM